MIYKKFLLKIIINLIKINKYNLKEKTIINRLLRKIKIKQD